jgi:hypothetical protein
MPTYEYRTSGVPLTYQSIRPITVNRLGLPRPSSLQTARTNDGLRDCGRVSVRFLFSLPVFPRALSFSVFHALAFACVAQYVSYATVHDRD